MKCALDLKWQKVAVVDVRKKPIFFLSIIIAIPLLIFIVFYSLRIKVIMNGNVKYIIERCVEFC